MFTIITTSYIFSLQFPIHVDRSPTKKKKKKKNITQAIGKETFYKIFIFV